MIEPIRGETAEQLAANCNTFEANLPPMSVFATQTHQTASGWVAFMYYRIHNQKVNK